MDIQTIAMIYAGGVFFWCFLMSAMGETVDWQYFASAFLWPFMLFHTLGSILRRAIHEARR